MPERRYALPRRAVTLCLLLLLPVWAARLHAAPLVPGAPTPTITV